MSSGSSSVHRVLVAFAAALLFTSCASEAPHWSYSGDHGPAQWGKLDPAWALADTGREQSPVDIQNAQPFDGDALVLDYQATPLDIVNNGHTVQVNYAPGSTLTIGGQVFTLKQFHFHAPSEHMVNGVHKAMEAHLVHANDVGQLLVVGVLFDVGDANAFLGSFWDKLPPVPSPGEEVVSVDAALKVNVADLLPADLASWRYMGSLTTPPCTEGVRWIVLQTDVSTSGGQVGAFMKLNGPNNRPIQQLNGRILRSVD